MRKASIAFILKLCLMLGTSVPLLAQELLHTCAEAHLRSAQRQATATPRHVQLMNQYDVSFYKLDLQLERNSTFIAGTVTTVAKITTTRLDAFAFELHPSFEITSVVINGINETNIHRSASDVSVTLTSPVLSPGTITAVITYSGTAPNDAGAAIGNGFSTATEQTWGNQVTWSLSQPYAAYEWWPTKQVLTDKADSVYVFVTTSAENKVGSNGLLTNTVNLPNNKKRYEWKSGYPIAYYLISVAVSNYEEYLINANPTGAEKPIPILNYIYRGSTAQFKQDIDATAAFLEHFSDLFGQYPFAREKYGHSMAPIGGGMEHQTMTTQSTFTFTLTAHELAHQWFGNHVTCSTWTDIWLNEGFATYAEYLALQKFSPQEAAQWLANTQNGATQTPLGTVRVPDTTNVGRIFDYRLSYEKAAAVVHMLRFEINNDELFYRALRNYLQQYGGGNATTADLQQVFEETTNRELTYFFNQWYSGEGYPSFAVEWNQKGNKLLIVNSQSSLGNSFFRTDLEYRVTTVDGKSTLFRVPHLQPKEEHLLNIEGTVASVEVDPNRWILRHVSQVVRNSSLIVPTEEEPTILYPNPAYTAVNIEKLPFSPTQADIYDGTGRLVKQLVPGNRSNGTVTVQVADLPAGYYILQLRDNTERFRSPFIKIRQP